MTTNAFVANRAPGGNLNLNDHSQRAVMSDKVVVPYNSKRSQYCH